jgi:hypothetical protein
LRILELNAILRKSSFLAIPTGPNPTYEFAPTAQLLHELPSEGIEVQRLAVVLSRFSADPKPAQTNLPASRRISPAAARSIVLE